MQGEGEQVVINFGVFRQPSGIVFQRFHAFSAADEYGFAACRGDGLQVAQAVADHIGFGGVGFEAGDDV